MRFYEIGSRRYRNVHRLRRIFYLYSGAPFGVDREKTERTGRRAGDHQEPSLSTPKWDHDVLTWPTDNTTTKAHTIPSGQSHCQRPWTPCASSSLAPSLARFWALLASFILLSIPSRPTALLPAARLFIAHPDSGILCGSSPAIRSPVNEAVIKQ